MITYNGLFLIMKKMAAPIAVRRSKTNIGIKTVAAVEFDVLERDTPT